MSAVISTDRLLLRPWREADARRALRIFSGDASRPWLPPEVRPVWGFEAMTSLLRGWQDEQDKPPAGHWAVETRTGSELIGGCSLSFGGPGPESLKLWCVLDPGERGRGYATEAGDALVRWAIHEGGVYEVYAVVQSDNAPAQATARRMGMAWVTETGGHGGSQLQVYRIRHGDLTYDDHDERSPGQISPEDRGTPGVPEAPPSERRGST